MPFSFQKLTDKAQQALNASPLAQHLPPSLTGSGAGGTPGATAEGGDAKPAAAAGGRTSSDGGGSERKNIGLENLHHAMRSLQVQYGSQATPEIKQLQLIVTAEKGVSLDYQNVAKDAKAQSKELYVWGQAHKSEDIKDVTDRLAYLNFVLGSLSGTLADSLEKARSPVKALRDAEGQIHPRRNLRAGVMAEISRIKNAPQNNVTATKLQELEAQLRKLEGEDEPLEKEVVLAQRSAIRDSEGRKWEAIREYGEKLSLLAQAAHSVISALPSIPPTETNPYTGSGTTAAARSALQESLDHYKPGLVNLTLTSVQPGSGVGKDTRSFGESHASELSAIPSPTGEPITSTAPIPIPGADAGYPHPLYPDTLNNTPAPIPGVVPTTEISSPVLATSTSGSGAGVAGSMPVSTLPTVAETGVPVSAGPEGPGPVSGSLARDEYSNMGSESAVGGQGAPGYGYGYGVGMGLARGWSGDSKELPAPPVPAHEAPVPPPHEAPIPPPHEAPAPPAHDAPPPAHEDAGAKHESAEDEKKRLEREERERILTSGSGVSGPPGPSSAYEPPEGPPPPAYEG